MKISSYFLRRIYWSWIVFLGFMSIGIAQNLQLDTTPIKRTRREQLAKKCVIRAQALRQKGNYQGALVEYDNALSINPSAYDIWIRKGQIYTTLKDWTNAIESYENAVKIKNNYLPAYLILRKLYLKRQDIRGAIEATQNAFKYDPNYTNKVQYKIQILRLLDKHECLQHALPHLQQAQSIAPENPSVLFYEAKYANLTGDYTRAIRSTEIALNHLQHCTPRRTAGFYYEQGYAYHHLGEYFKARLVLRKANYGRYKELVYQLSPEHHYRVALAYYQIHLYDEADKLLRKVLEMKADYAPVHSLCVRLADKKSNQSELIVSLVAAMEAEKDCDKKAKKLAQLSLLYYQAQNYSRALTVAKQSLELEEDNEDLALLRAMNLYQIERTPEAIRLLQNVLQQYGANNQYLKAKYFFALGVLYESVGNTKLAINSYRKASFGSFKAAATERLNQLHTETQGIL